MLADALPSAMRLPALVATHCLSVCRREHQQLQVVCSCLAGGILLCTDGSGDSGLADETERTPSPCRLTYRLPTKSASLFDGQKLTNDQW